jgi:soluble lytic murein transglycosylase
MGTRWRLTPGRRVVRRWIGIFIVLAVVWFAMRMELPVRYQSIIRQEAAESRVKPALVAAVIRVESGYRRDVVSPKGAVGLMQLMPATARWIQQEQGRTHALMPDLRNPRTNISLGTWYLSYLLGRYNDNLVLALAAYNSGPAVTDGWLRDGRLSFTVTNGSAIPYLETRNFVARVFRYQRFYRIVYGI